MAGAKWLFRFRKDWRDIFQGKRYKAQGQGTKDGRKKGAFSDTLRGIIPSPETTSLSSTFKMQR